MTLNIKITIDKIETLKPSDYFSIAAGNAVVIYNILLDTLEDDKGKTLLRSQAKALIDKEYPTMKEFRASEIMAEFMNKFSEALVSPTNAGG